MVENIPWDMWHTTCHCAISNRLTMVCLHSVVCNVCTWSVSGETTGRVFIALCLWRGLPGHPMGLRRFLGVFWAPWEYARGLEARLCPSPKGRSKHSINGEFPFFLGV
jgi:hypothetical protein